MAAALLSGCANGISARIQEKSAVYEQLRPEVQQAVRDGLVEPGYTADMVYMALGKPNRVEVKNSKHGPVGFWIYTNLYPEGYVPAEAAPTAAAEKVAASASPTATAENTASAPSAAQKAPASGAVASDSPMAKLPEDWAYTDQSVLGKSHGKSYWAFDRKGQKPYQASFSARDPGMEPLDIPDMESAALYVVFFEGHVVKMSLERR